MAEVQGTYDERFAGVKEALSVQLDSGEDLGASVAVYLEGEPVVDIWGGFTDEEKTKPWERDTIINVFSTTKTMTFLCALMLADRGELDFHQRVSHYWPEFAAAGKQDVEVRHIMGHTSGLSGWEKPLKLEDLADWDLCCSRLAEQEPWWEPGTQSGYHAVTQGYLIGEIVRRITGVSIGKFFAAEAAEPLGADFFIGTPESEDHRVAVLKSPPERELREALASIDKTSVMYRTFVNPPVDGDVSGLPWWRRCEIPAANGHGNARSVAAAQSVLACGGEARGVRLLSAEGCEPIFEQQAKGKDLVLGMPVRFGMGFGLSSREIPIGPRAFMWAGFGGSIVISDLDSRFTVAYVMNKMADTLTGDRRGFSIALAAVAGLANA